MPSSSLKQIVFNAKYLVMRAQALSFYSALLQNETLSSDEIENINWSKRRALLAHAYEKSSFYHQKYSQAGLQPKDIANRDDWHRIPALTREDLRQHFDTILTVPAESKYLGKSTTGGTTGVPVTTYFDRRAPGEALGWRMMRWWGIRPSDDGAYVWRMRRKPGIATWLNELAWWPTRRLRFDATSMSPAEIEDFLQSFNRLRPPLLQGYTGAIAHLSLHILERKTSVHSPKAIWVTSSPLSALQRGQIEQAFGAPVYDQYGSCEVGHMAAQCAVKQALHINCDSVHLEFVDDNGCVLPMDERGRIFVTDLDNLVFPLIRYENGDEGRALPGKCSCGIGLPLMDKVSGRISDIVRLPGGSVLNGEYLTTLFDSYPDAVKQFQVRQGRDYSITVFYVPNSEYANLALVVQEVQRMLEEKAKGRIPIKMISTNEINHDRGKFRFVISDA